MIKLFNTFYWDVYSAYFNFLFYFPEPVCLISKDFDPVSSFFNTNFMLFDKCKVTSMVEPPKI